MAVGRCPPLRLVQGEERSRLRPVAELGARLLSRSAGWCARASLAAHCEVLGECRPLSSVSCYNKSAMPSPPRIVSNDKSCGDVVVKDARH